MPEQILVRGYFSATEPGFVRASGAVTGAILRADGTWALPHLASRELTGSGTYTPTSGTRRARYRVQAGGGGGGGAGNGAGLAGAGGGNGGFFIEFWVGDGSTLLTGGAFSCGAGGAAGASGAGAGGTGGDTTIVVNGVTYTAKGGTGGGGATRSAAGVSGPNLPASGNSAVPIISYDQGGTSFWVSTIVLSGQGGMSPFGYGGYALGAEGVGIDGIRGGGGSGAVSSATNRAGGAGGAGLILIDEYS